jgi:zinc transporter, ZIP family
MNFSPSPLEINAFSLSVWASMGTFLGGLVVIFLIGLLGADPNSSSTARLMGILQSISAGVMIHMTAFHLIPESIMTISSRETMIYFFAGILGFGVLEFLVIPLLVPHNHDHEHKSPAPSTQTKPRTRSSPKKAENSTKKQQEEGIKSISKQDAFELYKTSVITFIAMSLHNIPEGISVYLSALTNPAMVSV